MSTEDRGAELRRGVDAYRAGDLASAIVAWQRLFQDIEDSDSLRPLLQALIQIAGAMQRLGGEESVSGAQKLLARASEKLEALPDVMVGLSIVRLREGLLSCRAEVTRLVDAGRRDLDATHAPPLEDAGDAAVEVSRERIMPRGPTDRLAHFAQALAAYQLGSYYEARGLWEELWRSELDPLHKEFIQSLLQLAAAMHKLDEGNAKAALHLIGRARTRLEGVPDAYGGIAMDALRRDIDYASAELAKVHVVGAPRARDLAPRIVPIRPPALA